MASSIPLTQPTLSGVASSIPLTQPTLSGMHYSCQGRGGGGGGGAYE